MKPKAYFAARFGRRAVLRGYAAELQALGGEVTSTWLYSQPPAPIPDITPLQWRRLAEKDLSDIERADVLVAFAETDGDGGGGRHVELGFALGLGKQVIVVGTAEHLFHHLEGVEIVPEWSDALELLAAWGEQSVIRSPER